MYVSGCVLIKQYSVNVREKELILCTFRRTSAVEPGELWRKKRIYLQRHTCNASLANTESGLGVEALSSHSQRPDADGIGAAINSHHAVLGLREKLSCRVHRESTKGEYVYMERERQTDKQTQRETERQRQRDRVGQRQTETERQRQTNRQTETKTERQREKDTETQIQRMKWEERDRERHRQRQRETESERERDRQRDKDRDTERERHTDTETGNEMRRERQTERRRERIRKRVYRGKELDLSAPESNALFLVN